MRFLQMLPGQKLILARIETKQSPIAPVTARYTYKPKSDPAIVRFILWLLVTLTNKPGQIRSAGDRFYRAIRTNAAALVFLGGIVVTITLEAMAAGYVQKMVGV